MDIMKDLWAKNKMMFIAAGVLVVLLVVGGGAYMVLGQKSASTNSADVPGEQTAVIPTLAPSEIGMSLAVTRGGKSVTMTANKLDGITGLDYEVTYTANNNSNDIPRGVIGHIDVKPGSIVNQEVVLGTCSDVCHYDTVTSPVKFSVKVTKTDGKVYEVDQSISL